MAKPAFNPFAHPAPKPMDPYARLRPALQALNALLDAGEAYFTDDSIIALFETHAADLVSHPLYSRLSVTNPLLSQLAHVQQVTPRAPEPLLALYFRNSLAALTASFPLRQDSRWRDEWELWLPAVPPNGFPEAENMFPNTREFPPALVRLSLFYVLYGRFKLSST